MGHEWGNLGNLGLRPFRGSMRERNIPSPMPSQEVLQDGNPVPLVVDVDGTFVCGDVLLEGLARLLAAAPHKLFVLPLWLAAGRAALKRRVANAVPVLPETLVLNPVVTDMIVEAQRMGRPVYLASAADERYVAPLAEHIKADGFFASDGHTNMAGETKAQKLTDRFGEGGFDYIGNEWRDLAIWRRARHAIAVNVSPALAKRIRAIDQDARFLPRTAGRLQDFLKALRPHQWIKNILVFAPLIAAHVTDPHALGLAVVAFFSLCACASGSYLLNDILDLPHDRQHETKRDRPLASGRLPLAHAFFLALALTLVGLASAAAVSIELLVMIACYTLVTAAYSLYLKRKTFIDMVTLASLYTIRVLVGSAAVSIPVSPWFLAFSMFFFLALAIVKRQRELLRLRTAGKEKVGGRAYFVEDLPVLAAFAGSSSFASVVVLAFYLNSSKVIELYARPELLWLLCPILIYWLGRMVLLANRGVVDDDPIVFALRDSTSWLVGLAAAAVFAGAL